MTTSILRDKTLYRKLEAKYLQFCESNEPEMGEYHEDFIEAHRNRVILPAVNRIEAIIKRLHLSVEEFWVVYDSECAI